MKDPKFDKDLKDMSVYIYQNGKGKIPAGWELIRTDSNNKTGYYAQAYKKGNEVVVVYRGTDVERGKIEAAKDILIGDIPMGGRLTSGQTQDARDTFDNIKKENPSLRIVVTGHSLGGSLAQVVSAETGSKAVTFNAYGTGKVLADKGYTNQRFLDITNYGNQNDPVFLGSKDNQPGTTYVTNTDLNPKSDMSWEKGLNKNLNRKAHDIDNMDKLDKAVKVGERGKDDKNSSSPMMLEGKISYESEYDRKADILADLKEPQNSKIQKVHDMIRNKFKSKSKSQKSESKGWVTINGAHIFLGK